VFRDTNSSDIEAAIILQIWRITCLPQARRRLRFTIRVIAESGLLYTLTSIATFCAELLPNQAPFVITSAIVCTNGLIVRIASHGHTQNFPVSGIAYNLILIRVAQNRANVNEDQTLSCIGNSTIERIQPYKSGTDPVETVV
jgi:hypothetical protein